MLLKEMKRLVMCLNHLTFKMKRLLLGDHNLTLYNHSKNRPTWRDVECHKRFEYVFFIINWFWGGVIQLTVRQMVSEPRSWVQVTRMSLWGMDCWRTTIWLPTTTLKTGSHVVMSNTIKNFSVSSSSPIGFKVEWHSSRSNIYHVNSYTIKIRIKV